MVDALDSGSSRNMLSGFKSCLVFSLNTFSAHVIAFAGKRSALTY